MKYIINKILTEEGIKLTINNNKQDIDSIDTVRVYSAWDWLKHKHDDDNHYQIPQSINMMTIITIKSRSMNQKQQGK